MRKNTVVSELVSQTVSEGKGDKDVTHLKKYAGGAHSLASLFSIPSLLPNSLFLLSSLPPPLLLFFPPSSLTH